MVGLSGDEEKKLELDHYILHRPLTNEAVIGRDSEDCWQSLLYVTLVISSWPDNIMTAPSTQLSTLRSVSHLNKKIKEISWSVLWISISPPPSQPPPCS